MGDAHGEHIEVARVLPVKRSPAATVRRTARRAVTWRPKEAGSEPVRIRRLVSPLRYDVLVRAQFFAFLEQERRAGRLEAPGAELVDAARDEPYFVWFEKVAMARFRPWVLQDPDLLHEQYAERVMRSAALWKSFQANGFDRRYPVMLRGVKGPRRTDSGAVVDRRLHVGDGGHRLALLLAGGQEELAPGMYRVDRRPATGLIDNTAVLLPALGLSEQDYATFLSAGYAEVELDDLADLVAHVRDHDPARLGELETVLAAHRRPPEPAA